MQTCTGVTPLTLHSSSTANGQRLPNGRNHADDDELIDDTNNDDHSPVIIAAFDALVELKTTRSRSNSAAHSSSQRARTSSGNSATAAAAAAAVSSTGNATAATPTGATAAAVPNNSLARRPFTASEGLVSSSDGASDTSFEVAELARAGSDVSGRVHSTVQQLEVAMRALFGKGFAAVKHCRHSGKARPVLLTLTVKTAAKSKLAAALTPLGKDTVYYIYSGSTRRHIVC
jgi:hypothetical protein